MDPILVELARKLFAASRSLRRPQPAAPSDATRVGAVKPQAAPTFSDAERADLNAYILDQSQGKYTLDDVEKVVSDPQFQKVGLRNVGRSVAQGITMNNADEAIGVPMIPIPGFGPVPNPVYQGPDATNETRLKDELFAGTHPYVDAAGRMAGGAAVTLPAIAAAPEAAIPSMLLNGGVGALTGAMAARGAAETPEQANDADLGGAAIGGVLGGLVPGIISLGKYAKDPVGYATNARMRSMVARSGGVDAMKAANADMAAAGRGDQTMLADLSQPARTELERAANGNLNVFERLFPQLKARKAGQRGRLEGDTGDLIGGPAKKLPDAGARTESLTESRDTWADQAYSDLRANNPEVKGFHIPSAKEIAEAKAAAQQLSVLKSSMPKPGATNGSVFPSTASAGNQAMIDKLEDTIAKGQPTPTFMLQPEVRSALRAAQKTGMVGLDVEPAELASFDKMFTFMQNVRDRANAAMAAGGGKSNLGIRLHKVADAIKDNLTENVPEFGAINANFRRMSGVIEKIGDGEAWWERADTRALGREIAKLPADQASSLRYGLASKWIGWLRAQKPNRNIAEIIANPSDDMADKLKTIFGDQYPAFQKRAAAEATLGRLERTIGNSKTAVRQADQSSIDPADLALRSAGGHLIHPGFVGSMMARTGSWAARRMLVAEKAAAIEPLLMTKGTPAIDALLDALRGQAPTVPPWVNAGAGAAGALAGRPEQP